MPYELNNKIKELTPYEPITGDYRIRLDANESYIQYPKEKLQTALNQGLNRYPDPYAKKLCESFSKLYSVKANNVTAGNGSDELISLIVGAFFTHGDTLLTLSHDFSMYRFYGNVFGIKTEVFSKKTDLTIDVDALISYINEHHIAGLIFSNPCNPTSLSLNREAVIKLVSSVNALVVVDEAYMDFSDQSILDVCCNYSNVMVLKTCSKAIGLAAIRLGFAIANDKITKALRAVKSPYNVNAVTQSIGEIVLNDDAYVKECTANLLINKTELYNEILKLSQKTNLFEVIYPSSTNFLFIKTNQSKYIFEELLKRSIAIRYMGDYIRITTGSKAENKELIEALKEIVEGCLL
ncbi:histidinol-phosphate transaminase [Paludicola sp. MB14-C6]|uniref:pyridoxal phosphate-dependent aminotransferase n=1 Tax=Paludihabitans sp. MB14-C6 TaxID=3070656 RepID=UPI0027DACCE2|nr:histidinol-phosphate transaminase [Paludicola sp. MB14-C6]WMJ23633.1 histidinol-phosphate transaminase [Paludicola sp. MB14-C6]